MSKQTMDSPQIRLIQFNTDHVSEKAYNNIDEVLGKITPDKISLLNIDGLNDIAPIKAIGQHINISSLALKSILNTGQRSKVFEGKNSITNVAKTTEFSAPTNKIIGEQIGDNLEQIEHKLTTETYYQMTSNQLTIYNTNVNIKANDVIKVLAIFTSIFIPLNLIVGIYGTNFEYLPELQFKYEYFGMWRVMITVVVGMLFYFKNINGFSYYLNAYLFIKN